MKRMKLIIILFKMHFIIHIVFWSTIAASQDGLVKSEFNAIKKLCKQMNIDESFAQQCVDLIKEEQKFRDKVYDTMKWTQV